GAIAAHLQQRRLDEPALEVADGGVITGRAAGERDGTVDGFGEGVHGRAGIATDVPRRRARFVGHSVARRRAGALHAGRRAQNEGPRERALTGARRRRTATISSRA